jgi:hypothetical protein
MSNEIVELSVTEIIKMATQIGIESGIKEFENQKKLYKQKRSERRLRNTRILLENYRSFKLFCNNAVSGAESKVSENAFDILDSLDDIDNESLFVESISKSVARTIIMVNHIITMMDIFEEVCKKKKKYKYYKVLYYMYIQDENICNEKIAEKIGQSERQLYNVSNSAIEALSPIMFGIDYLKIN